ncbi:MAG: hypothetical protein GC155_09075 [Alphaproteobacteria bacterium]|nr:hypothetical protein [Alphaproteobacteria bacterium]
MRHAGQATLDQLEDVLTALRRLDGLKENSRGVFYRGGRAFLHFHEDPDGLFADVRFAADFERSRVSTAAERSAFLRKVRAGLDKPQARG